MTQTQPTQQARIDLSDAPCVAVLSCTDLATAQNFYTKTLGLPLVASDDQGFRVQAGNDTNLYIYERPEAPQAENTVATFVVNDVPAMVDALRDNGVTFEEYALPHLQTENGIATVGGSRSAWFKDPDGNILAISEM